MEFLEIIEQARTALQSKGRITYRTLKRQFALDDEALDDLKFELIEGEEVAADKDGKMLVWTGGKTPEEITSQTGDTLAAALPAAASSPQPESQAPAGERRQLTVMFCDLVGSTALSEQLDPEDLHALIRTYQEACRQVIERYEGSIAQYLGDGILVYFGYPVAHEDDAIRGVRAGLDILAAVSALALAQPIRVRVGLHTGPVVIGAVGEGAHTEQLALGETPNIAARVQGTAAAQTVAISAATYHLVHGFFVCEDLGPQALKGLSTPLRLYQVTGAGAAQNRFDVSVQQGLTPLIGREEEVELLLRRWERAKAGQGQVVLLSGEAGIGKSRLVQVLRDHSQTDPHLSLQCRCSPLYQNSAFSPVIDHMQQVLQFNTDDNVDAKLTKLTQSLAPVDMQDEETVALFATLLSLPLPDSHPQLQYSPQKHKEKTLQALVTWLHKTALQQLVRLEFEDLHWADPSTLELLGLLMDHAPNSRLLLLLTFRPEFTPPWPMHAQTLQLSLTRLPQQDIAAMVERVAGKPLPADVVQQLLAKSDGVPLYIEEMTKNLLESGLLTETNGHYALTGPLPDMAIPSSLQDSFAARLDRLARVRELAQIGAVLGREFSYALIQAVSGMDDAQLHDSLGQLRAAEILFQRGVPPDAIYTFKHALLQDAAYASLLKSQRQQFHAQTATVLAQQFPETMDLHPELLAHHYTEAGLAAQAIPYWQQAAQRATQQFANVEALSHLTAGLAAVSTLADSPDRVQQELLLQVACIPPLFATKSWAAPELETTYTRALTLCDQLGDTPLIFPVLVGLAALLGIRGDMEAARKMGEQTLQRAQQTQDAGHLLAAHSMLTYPYMLLGKLDIARAHGEQARALYDPQQHQSLALVYGQDLGVTGRFFTAETVWLQGYPDQALTHMAEALTLAQDVAQPFSLAMTQMHYSWVHQFRRDVRAVQAHATACLALATEHGLPFFSGMGTFFGEWARVVQTHAPEAVIAMGENISQLQPFGGEAGQDYMLLLLAEGYGSVGNPGIGLERVTEALQLCNKRGQRWMEAELHRLKGELTLQTHAVGQQSHVEEAAEACFHTALAVARDQHAKSWELRAATSLARLWQSQGKRTEARDLLTPVYNWFTEGFDTADLKDAKALLDELSI